MASELQCSALLMTGAVPTLPRTAVLLLLLLLLNCRTAEATDGELRSTFNGPVIFEKRKRSSDTAHAAQALTAAVAAVAGASIPEDCSEPAACCCAIPSVTHEVHPELDTHILLPKLHGHLTATARATAPNLMHSQNSGSHYQPWDCIHYDCDFIVLLLLL